eukprot:9358852-Alexandrium_andersonii.AAC.1
MRPARANAHLVPRQSGPCRAWARGFCDFGDQCRLFHSGRQSSGRPAVQLTERVSFRPPPGLPSP